MISNHIIRGGLQMKKISIMFLVLIMILSFASIQVSAAEDDQLSVAILLPGPISDQGWNMVAYNALKHVEEKLGVKTAYSEQVPASDYEEIFRGYASSGYDIIMGHGFEFGDAAKKVAKDFKDKNFIVTSTNITQEPNVASFRINDAQSGFVQGVIAALLTETGKVGTLGGMEIPPIINQQKGFKAGVEYIDEDIEVISSYTGSFHDVAKGKEMTKAMAEEGVDIIVADADQTNLGVIEAAKEEDLLVLGSSGDLGKNNPEVVVTSLVEDFSVAFETVVKEVKQDNFKVKAYELGIADDVVSLAPYRKFEDEISEENKEKINEVVEKFRTRELSVDEYLEY